MGILAEEGAINPNLCYQLPLVRIICFLLRGSDTVSGVGFVSASSGGRFPISDQGNFSSWLHILHTQHYNIIPVIIKIVRNT